MFCYYIHLFEIRREFEKNLLELKENKTKKFFLKLFLFEKEKYEFFDYGYLEGQNFYGFKSKLNIFSIPKIESVYSREDSNNHLIITAKDIFLVYSPYTEVIDMILDMYG
jgi:hypothetical protein